MTKIHCATAFLIGASFIAAPVLAGEIKGPSPADNIPGPPGTSVSNCNSNCSYSGLNDTPDGFGTPGTPTYDPGGQVQSFGYFMSHFDVADPSDPDDRSSFGFPSQGVTLSTPSAGTNQLKWRALARALTFLPSK